MEQVRRGYVPEDEAFFTGRKAWGSCARHKKTSCI